MIHKTAIIDKDAMIGNNVEVGPYCVIGSNVKIGDNNKLHSHVNISGNVKIVGVTTLTSLNNKSIKEIGYNKSLRSLVAHQALLARKANLDGLVCSGHEINFVKKIFKKEIITPGIRFDSKINDQKSCLKSFFERNSLSQRDQSL